MAHTGFRLMFLIVLLMTLSFGSCKSIKHIPDDLKFNPRKHAHVRTMRLHMLFIDRANGKKLKYSRMRRIYEVQMVPGMITLDLIYSGGTNPHARHALNKHGRGTYYYWTYKKQKKRIRFRALRGRAHFIQYIVHRKGPMTVWHASHDYISHLRKKPVYKRDLSKNRTMKVSRVVRGSRNYIKKRFLNELLLQEFMQELIGSWSISLMFKVKGNTITANRSGIGEQQLDNWVSGYYKFDKAGRGRTRITMYVKLDVYGKYANYMKQVFTRFDPRYRVRAVK